MQVLLHALLLGLLVVVTGLETEQTRHAVEQLTDSSFDSAVEGGKQTWLFMIYSPHCSHCRTMLPVLDQVKAHYGNAVSVGRMIGDDNLITAKRFQITKYPSVYVLHDRRVFEYPGPWDAANTIAFIEGVRAGKLDEHVIAWHQSPLNMMNVLYSKFLGYPRKLHHVYDYLRNERGISESGLIGLAVAVVVIAAACFIVCLDLVYAASPSFVYHREHAD